MPEQEAPLLIQEDEVPENWKPTEAAPIQPQSAPPPADGVPYYFRGSISPNLQHDAYLVGALGKTSRIASTPLMPPPPSANPQINSAIQSSIIVNTSTSTTISTGLKFRGTWLASTQYAINDVVIFNGAAYVAILASTGLQPDNNHDNGPAEGNFSLGSPAWTLLSENFVFNANPVAGSGVGWAAFIARQLNNTALGNSGVIGPITTSTVGEIGFLVSCQSTDNVPAAGWTRIFADGFSDGAYVKTFPNITTINDTIATSRGAQLLLFGGQWNKSLSLTITSVAIASNVVTCLCANNFIVGTQITFSGLSSANFLNGTTATITAANSTSFQVSFTHANYGPTADSGTATNLPYLQTSGLITGASGNPSFTFPNPIKVGSVLIACATSNDINYIPNINSISTTQGDSFTILNSNGFISGSAFSADIAYAQVAKGGNTTISLTVTGPSSALKVCFFEMPGAPPAYVPYDVFEFRGSFFVCLKETSQDAFADPTSWGQISQGTGSVDAVTGTYTATLSDYGRLIINKTSSTVTVNLPAVPPINSWWTVVGVEQGSGGTITLSPNGATIDGSSANRTLSDGQSLFIFADGGAYDSIGGFGLGSAMGGVNEQTVSYTAVLGDSGKLVSMNGSNLTLTLPNPVPTARWFIAIQNINSTALTIANNGLTIDGVLGSLLLGSNGGIVIYSDGTNYRTLHGVNAITVPSIFTISGPDGGGNVTIGFVNQSAGKVFASPPTTTGQPSFRALVASDIPIVPLAVAEVQATFQSGTVTGVLRLPGNLIPPKGIYRVSGFMLLQANPAAGSLDMAIGWTDQFGNSDSDANGVNGAPNDINTASAAGTFSSGTMVVVSDGIHDITFTMTLT